MEVVGVLPYKAAIEVAGFGRKVRLQGFVIRGAAPPKGEAPSEG